MPINLASTRTIYPNDEQLIADIVAGYKKVIADLYAAGCRNIQFDDCTWGVLSIQRQTFSSEQTISSWKSFKSSF